jgi:hypothetical protein
MSEWIIDALERWSAVDSSHLRRLMAGASGRFEIVKPLDLLRTQLEAYREPSDAYSRIRMKSKTIRWRFPTGGSGAGFPRLAAKGAETPRGVPRCFSVRPFSDR